jgi:hypothetical protein
MTLSFILPDDIIEYILSYGDPIINEKYTLVMIQLEYLNDEFNYNRLKPYNVWYGYPSYWFKKYALCKNNNKISLNCRVSSY